MPKGIVWVDYTKCMACTACVVACPFDYLELKRMDIHPFENAYPILKLDHACTGCALCVKACPIECMKIH